MALPGKAFLCIWNDHDPAQAQAYEAWHTFEHVPERVCAPGFLEGRRYAAYDRDSSRYFTLYALDSLTALDTPQYRDLQDNPTVWSRDMRVAFRNFLRIPCETLVSQGIGLAGAAGTLALRVRGGCNSLIQTLSAQLADEWRQHAVTAYHIGRTHRLPAYGVFQQAADDLGDDDLYMLVIEGVCRRSLDAVLTRLAQTVAQSADTVHTSKQESSQLLFAIPRRDLADSPLHRSLPA